MGAAEVELDPVASGVLCAFDDLVPGFAIGLDHERGEEGVIGEVAFDVGDLAQVDLEGAVGDELDVVQSDDLSSVVNTAPYRDAVLTMGSKP